MFKRAFDAIRNAYEYAKEKVHNVIDNATGKVVAVGTGPCCDHWSSLCCCPG